MISKVLDDDGGEVLPDISSFIPTAYLPTSIPSSEPSYSLSPTVYPTDSPILSIAGTGDFGRAQQSMFDWKFALICAFGFIFLLFVAKKLHNRYPWLIPCLKKNDKNVMPWSKDIEKIKDNRVKNKETSKQKNISHQHNAFSDDETEVQSVRSADYSSRRSYLSFNSISYLSSRRSSRICAKPLNENISPTSTSINFNIDYTKELDLEPCLLNSSVRTVPKLKGKSINKNQSPSEETVDGKHLQKGVSSMKIPDLSYGEVSAGDLSPLSIHSKSSSGKSFNASSIRWNNSKKYPNTPVKASSRRLSVISHELESYNHLADITNDSCVSNNPLITKNSITNKESRRRIDESSIPPMISVSYAKDQSIDGSNAVPSQTVDPNLINPLISPKQSVRIDIYDDAGDNLALDSVQLKVFNQSKGNSSLHRSSPQKNANQIRSRSISYEPSSSAIMQNACLGSMTAPRNLRMNGSLQRGLGSGNLNRTSSKVVARNSVDSDEDNIPHEAKEEGMDNVYLTQPYDRGFRSRSLRVRQEQSVGDVVITTTDSNQYDPNNNAAKSNPESSASSALAIESIRSSTTVGSRQHILPLKQADDPVSIFAFPKKVKRFDGQGHNSNQDEICGSTDDRMAPKSGLGQYSTADIAVRDSSIDLQISPSPRNLKTPPTSPENKLFISHMSGYDYNHVESKIDAMDPVYEGQYDSLASSDKTRQPCEANDHTHSNMKPTIQSNPGISDDQGNLKANRVSSEQNQIATINKGKKKSGQTALESRGRNIRYIQTLGKDDEISSDDSKSGESVRMLDCNATWRESHIFPSHPLRGTKREMNTSNRVDESIVRPSLSVDQKGSEGNHQGGNDAPDEDMMMSHIGDMRVYDSSKESETDRNSLKQSPNKSKLGNQKRSVRRMIKDTTTKNKVIRNIHVKGRDQSLSGDSDGSHNSTSIRKHTRNAVTSTSQTKTKRNTKLSKKEESPPELITPNVASESHDTNDNIQPPLRQSDSSQVATTEGLNKDHGDMMQKTLTNDVKSNPSTQRQVKGDSNPSIDGSKIEKNGHSSRRLCHDSDETSRSLRTINVSVNDRDIPAETLGRRMANVSTYNSSTSFSSPRRDDSTSRSFRLKGKSSFRIDSTADSVSNDLKKPSFANLKFQIDNSHEFFSLNGKEPPKVDRFIQGPSQKNLSHDNHLASNRSFRLEAAHSTDPKTSSNHNLSAQCKDVESSSHDKKDLDSQDENHSGDSHGLKRRSRSNMRNEGGHVYSHTGAHIYVPVAKKKSQSIMQSNTAENTSVKVSQYKSNSTWLSPRANAAISSVVALEQPIHKRKDDIPSLSTTYDLPSPSKQRKGSLMSPKTMNVGVNLLAGHIIEVNQGLGNTKTVESPSKSLESSKTSAWDHKTEETRNVSNHRVNHPTVTAKNHPDHLAECEDYDLHEEESSSPIHSHLSLTKANTTDPHEVEMNGTTMQSAEHDRNQYSKQKGTSTTIIKGQVTQSKSKGSAASTLSNRSKYVQHRTFKF